MKTNLTSSTQQIHILTADRSYTVAARPRPDMATGENVCFEIADDAGAPRFCIGDFVYCTPDGDGWRVCRTIANETAAARMGFFAGLR